MTMGRPKPNATEQLEPYRLKAAKQLGVYRQKATRPVAWGEA